MPTNDPYPILDVEADPYNFNRAEIPNNRRRLPCLLLLDTSSSMGGAPISELNAGLQQLYDELLGDPVACDSVEVGIVTFGKGGVQVLRDFRNVKVDDCPVLAVDGQTPMSGAIVQGLDLLVARRAQLAAQAISQYKPWVFLITDGAPTDGLAAFEAAALRVRAGEEREFMFFAIGVKGADMGLLGRLSARPPVKLDGIRFRDLFKWISGSLAGASRSAPGTAVALAPLSWSTVRA